MSQSSASQSSASQSSAKNRRAYSLCLVAMIAIAGFLFVHAHPAAVRAASSTPNPSPLKSSLVKSSPVKYRASTPVAANVLTDANRQRISASMGAIPIGFAENDGQMDARVKYSARGNGYKLYLTSSEAIFAVHKPGHSSPVMDAMMNRRRGLAKVASRRKQQLKEGQQPQSLASAVHMRLLGADPQAKIDAERRQTAKANYFIGRDPSKWRSGVPLFEQVRYQRLYPGIDLAFHGSGRQMEFDYLVAPHADAKAIALGFTGADKIAVNDAGDLILTTAAGPLEMHRPVAYQEKNGLRQNVDARFSLAKNQVTFALGAYDHSRELVIDPTVTYSTYFEGDFNDYGLAIAADGSGNAYIAGATDSDTIPGDSNGTDSLSFDVFVTEITSTGTLVFTTEFGGSSDEFPGGIALDGAGNIYVSGTTDSSDLPDTSAGVQPAFLGGPSTAPNDAFAVKFAPGGASVTWATYIGGSDDDTGLAVAVDGSSNVYVVGETFSEDLGCNAAGTAPCLQSALGVGAINLNSGSGADDGYIAKINSTGNAYLLLSYIGGSNGDLATGVALDSGGNIYVSGETISTDLPVTSGVVQSQCGTDGTCNSSGGSPLDDAFIAGIHANLSGFVYLTYYGGSNLDDAYALAADSAGNVFFTGTTASSDFPTAGTPYQTALAGTQNAFAVELNSTGTAASYGTYLGGSGVDYGLGAAVDSSDNIYVTGQTSSSDFPVANATQPTFGGSTDAFITVLSPAQNIALFSTYLGGGGDEDQAAGAIALDSLQNIYVTGDTTSGNGSTTAFPTQNPIQGTYTAGGPCSSGSTNVPCPHAFITAYGPATAADFTIAAAAPATVAPGSSATSTITLTALNAYNSPVNLSCSVTGTGSPLPSCSATSAFSPNPVTPTAAGATSTLTITTTGSTAALVRPSKFFYAMWLPIAGLSLIGMGFSSARNRRKTLLGFFAVITVMAALILMPACGGGSSNNGGGGGGGGCTGCTSAGTYTVTITGTGTDSAATTHATTVTLTVN